MDCPINRSVISTPLHEMRRGVPLSILEGERKLIYCPGRPPLPPSGGVPMLPPVPSGGVPMPPPG